jgi:hypothetical protein
VKKIRVIKPRVGGGFGGKQEMLIEDLCAHLTIATGRPVRFEYTRAQEFTSARSRHPQRMVFKAGFKKDPNGGPPILHALSHYVIGNHRRVWHSRHHRADRQRDAWPEHLPLPQPEVPLPRRLYQYPHPWRFPWLRRATGRVRPRMPNGTRPLN